MGQMQAAYYPGYDPKRLRELCERFSLPMNERISSFSKGTQKRAQICLGLPLNPRVLLCDETFDGLDPVMRDQFKRVLSQETLDRGLITVLAGHNQQEMEDICDSVGFLHEGKLVCSGDLDSLLSDVHRGGYPHLTALQQDITAWDMPDGSFDVVTLLEVLEHIPNVETAIAAAVRLARRCIILSVPSKPDDNPEHIHLLTKGVLTGLFRDAGCTKLHFSGVNGHLIMMASVNAGEE